MRREGERRWLGTEMRWAWGGGVLHCRGWMGGWGPPLADAMSDFASVFPRPRLCSLRDDPNPGLARPQPGCGQRHAPYHTYKEVPIAVRVAPVNALGPTLQPAYLLMPVLIAPCRFCTCLGSTGRSLLCRCGVHGFRAFNTYIHIHILVDGVDAGSGIGRCAETMAGGTIQSHSHHSSTALEVPVPI